MLISFQLTMPNVGSWNGVWTANKDTYFVVRNVSKRYLQKEPHFKTLCESGRDSFFYSWNDGWSARIIVEIVDAKEARRRRAISSGFCNYEWMINSIIYYGNILNERERKEQIALENAKKSEMLVPIGKAVGDKKVTETDIF